MAQYEVPIFYSHNALYHIDLDCRLSREIYSFNHSYLQCSFRLLNQQTLASEKNVLSSEEHK